MHSGGCRETKPKTSSSINQVHIYIYILWVCRIGYIWVKDNFNRINIAIFEAYFHVKIDYFLIPLNRSFEYKSKRINNICNRLNFRFFQDWNINLN